MEQTGERCCLTSLQTELEEMEGILSEVTKTWDSQCSRQEVYLGDSKARRTLYVLEYSLGYHKDTSWRCLNRLQHLRAWPY